MSKDIHQPTAGERIISGVVTIAVHTVVFLLFILSSGPENTDTLGNASEKENIFCRYIENGRMFTVEVSAVDWQDAEEIVCGSHMRDVRLSPLLLEGAQLILDGASNDVVLAQRESCSCSKEERVPILQDIGIVQAPRLGAETKKTALPRIINTPEQTQANTVTTEKTNTPPKEKKKTSKEPNLDNLLNAASNFDEARPISDVDPGGSADGSRLSKSATGSGDPYLQKIKAKLDNNMNAPASIPKAKMQKLKAKIWIRIGENGVVWNWDFYSKSGDAAFDKMIEECIKNFKMGGNMKFPIPPDNWKLQPIPITVEGSEIR